MVHVKQVCQEQEVRVNYKGDCEELGWRQLETEGHLDRMGCELTAFRLAGRV